MRQDDMDKEFIKDNPEKNRNLRDEKILSFIDLYRSKEKLKEEKNVTTPILQFEYDEIVQRIASTNDEKERSELTALLNKIEIIDYPSANQNTVTLGSKIIVEFEYPNGTTDEFPIEFKITGLGLDFEDKFDTARVSSKLGEILFGKKVNETAEFEVSDKSGKSLVKILQIEQITGR